MSAHGLNSESNGSETAPLLQVPARSIAVIEHPCIVKNLDKGIVSLGGAVKLSQVGSPGRTANVEAIR